MATVTQVYERWLNFNLYGRGKETGSVSSHRYAGPVYYYGDVPMQRFVNRDGDKPVIVMRNTLVNMEPTHKLAVKTIHVEDLSVFSKYRGDMLKDEDMHARQRFIIQSDIFKFVDEDVPGFSDESCTMPQMEWKTLKALNHKIERYQDYNELFKLGWPPLPDSLRQRVSDTINAKIARWTDPKAVTKRERAAAKRMANKALGLV